MTRRQNGLSETGEHALWRRVRRGEVRRSAARLRELRALAGTCAVGTLARATVECARWAGPDGWGASTTLSVEERAARAAGSPLGLLEGGGQ